MRLWLIVSLIFAEKMLLAQELNRIVLLHNYIEKSPYAVFNLKSPDFSGRVVISAYDLYKYFLRTRHINNTYSFADSICSILSKNGYLTINDSLSNSKWGFYIASQVDTISNYVKLGKKEFLIHYFGKNRSTKYNLTEINPIVCQLFDWGIITYYGNELPRLYIIKPSILSIITKNSLRKCKKCNTKTILIILNKYISAYNKTVEEWDKE